MLVQPYLFLTQAYVGLPGWGLYLNIFADSCPFIGAPHLPGLIRLCASRPRASDMNEVFNGAGARRVIRRGGMIVAAQKIVAAHHIVYRTCLYFFHLLQLVQLPAKYGSGIEY